MAGPSLLVTNTPQGPTMHYEIPPAPIRSKLYDALESLRLADLRLREAFDAFQDVEVEYISDRDLYACGAAVRVYIGIFQELVGGAIPTLGDRVFASVAMHANQSDRNRVPHIEGIILALTLAARSLEDALDQSGAIRGDDCDALDDAMIGCLEMAACNAGLFNSICIFDASDTLQRILDGRPLPDGRRLPEKYLVAV